MLIAIFLTLLIYSGVSIVQAITKINEIAPASTTLNQSHFTGLINKVNEIANKLNSSSVGLGSLSIESFSHQSSCIWKTIKTNEKAICDNGQYISATCLTSKDQGCPNGIATGTNSEWEVAGAIKCCNIK